MKLIIAGAGGHGQVVADICASMKKFGFRCGLAGFIDHDPRLIGTVVHGLPVFGYDRPDEPGSVDAVVVAIGNNAARKSVSREWVERGVPFFSAVHPTAVIGGDVQIGEGTMISANVVVISGSVIGAHVILNTACSVDHHNRLADFVHVAPGVRLGGNVTVGEGSLLGIGSIVLPGIRIGDWSVVGAGSVVTRDVPDRSVVYGSPAKVARRIDGD
jgi:sugar O-acyltransferase (sialic acid O-acetyltransferase NeuD family)